MINKIEASKCCSAEEVKNLRNAYKFTSENNSFNFH